MTEKNITTPKTFISYSWTTDDHTDWVLRLAQRLRVDGVDVVIDRWDLQPGDDKYSFMEKMVSDNTVSHVLMILDEGYKKKADARSGGAGTETQIISAEIYSKTQQEKFIPIIATKDAEGNPFQPIYLKSRIYIDLSEHARTEAEYDRLLRFLFKRPEHPKPELGKPPSHLFTDTANTYKLTSISNRFSHAIERNPSIAGALVREFVTEFYKEFEAAGKTETNSDKYLDIGRVLHENIQSCLPLRNEYLRFMQLATQPHVQFDVDLLIHFFERIVILKDPPNSNKHPEYMTNYPFMYHELFIYTILISLQNENYKLVSDLFHSKYLFEDKYSYRREGKNFAELNQNIRTFDQYVHASVRPNAVGPRAELMIRQIPEFVRLEELIWTDLLCDYVARTKDDFWFPWTYIYREVQQFPLLERMVSKRHFEKIKVVFDIQTPQQFAELANKISQDRAQSRGYDRSFSYIPTITSFIQLDKIATQR